MIFAIKAEVADPWPKTFAFTAQKTMYGGKRIAKGDAIFVFASGSATFSVAIPSSSLGS